MKLLCWNVNGLRAIAKKGFLEWMFNESPDILTVQEIKAQMDQLEPELLEPNGYYSTFNPAERKGYSGVATFSKKKPLNVEIGLGDSRFDNEGRVILSDHGDFLLYNIYFPNGGMNDERLQYKLMFYDAILIHFNNLKSQGKKIVICGDYNTAHKEIDLARPKENRNTSGFMPIECAWLDKLTSCGFVDTFRMFNQEAGQYTWWDMKARARDRNVGWRIDYFFVSDNLVPHIKNAWIMPDVQGSDHCPIGLELQF